MVIFARVYPLIHYSKYQHDAGEFCSDLLHLLSEESEIVSDFFSLTLTEVNGICHK